MSVMTDRQQEQFAAYIRERAVHPSRFYLMSFREIASEALGEEVIYWRCLNQTEARTVMRWLDHQVKAKSEEGDPQLSPSSVPTEVSHHDSTTADLFGTIRPATKSKGRGRK